MVRKIIDEHKPLYLQIKEAILQQIKEKELVAGDKLLSEAQFKRAFMSVELQYEKRLMSWWRKVI